jgi:hypothetical protein
MIKAFKDFEVYNLSYTKAMEIFFLTGKFPEEETYSQPSGAKRTSENNFKVQFGALGSAAQTQNWILFAKDSGYITVAESELFNNKLDTIGKMLTKLHQHWKSSLPASSL